LKNLLPCRPKLLVRWRLPAALLTAVFLGEGLAALELATGLNVVGRRLLLIAVLIAAPVMGVRLLPWRWCKPYRLRHVDRDRGIMRIKAINPQYTAMLAALARAADGVDKTFESKS
jgi:hypothetical protein